MEGGVDARYEQFHLAPNIAPAGSRARIGGTEPTYPLPGGDTDGTRKNPPAGSDEPWRKWRAGKAGVMVGEFGVVNGRPAGRPAWSGTAWTWTSGRWGWALWNVRGGFGLGKQDRARVLRGLALGTSSTRAM